MQKVTLTNKIKHSKQDDYEFENKIRTYIDLESECRLLYTKEKSCDNYIKISFAKFSLFIVCAKVLLIFLQIHLYIKNLNS